MKFPSTYRLLRHLFPPTKFLTFCVFLLTIIPSFSNLSPLFPLRLLQISLLSLSDNDNPDCANLRRRHRLDIDSPISSPTTSSSTSTSGGGSDAVRKGWRTRITVDKAVGDGDLVARVGRRGLEGGEGGGEEIVADGRALDQWL